MEDLKYTNDSRNILFRYILFIFWPIFGVIEALVNYRLKGSKTILTLYGFIWGLSFDFSDPACDGSRYAERFSEFFHVNFWEFLRILGQYGEEGFTDLYTRVSFFLISRFTTDASILFGIWGMVYFYFLASAILEIVRFADNNDLKLLRYSPIFLVGFIFLMPLNAINGVRMWTAFMIFFTYSFRAIIENNKRYIIGAACAILVHFSFMIPLIALILYWKLKRYPIVLYLLVVVTFITSSYTSSFLENYSEYFSDGFAIKMNGYSNEEYVSRVHEMLSEQVWYAKYKLDILKYYLFTVFLIPFFYYKTRLENNPIYHLFLFTLTLWSLYNMTTDIGSSGRFFSIFAFSCLAFLTLFGTKYYELPYMKISKYVGVVPIGLYVLVTQVNALRFFDLFIAFGNIFTIPFSLLSI